MKQIVIRTYNNYKYDVDNNIHSLTEALEDGYVVILATPIDDTYIEYILEKK